jgi:hypothetical protein
LINLFFLFIIFLVNGIFCNCTLYHKYIISLWYIFCSKIVFKIIYQFNEIDELYTKEEFIEKISKKTKSYFFIELILSISLSLISLILKSKILLISCLPTTIYNIYSYFKKTYILEYEISSPKNNQKNYYQESFKFKIKTGIYILILVISSIMLFIDLMFFLIDFILDNKIIKDKITEYLEILRLKFSKKK